MLNDASLLMSEPLFCIEAIRSYHMPCDEGFSKGALILIPTLLSY
jgi:hypothetical protein